MSYTSPAAGLCVATALFVCGVTGFPTPPVETPPSVGSLELGSGGSSLFAPGASLTVSGSGFADNASITFALYSSPEVLAYAVADNSGNVSTTLTLPGDVGEHTLAALGNGPGDTGRALESTIDIETAYASSNGLASTGFDAAAWILGAVGMIVAGFILIRTVVFKRKLVPAAVGKSQPPADPA